MEASQSPGKALEERKLDLEARRLALDESFPKKWGTVIFSVLGTVAVAIISAALAYVQQRAQDAARQQEAQRLENARHIENARTALDIYFKNLPSMDPKDSRSANNMALIAVIADEPGVQDIFRRMIADIIAANQKAARASGHADAAVSDLAVGLPDVVRKAAQEAYVAKDFLAYIQYPEGRKADAEQLAAVLAQLGMKTPGIELVRSVPTKNQIRYYKAAQRDFATQLAGQRPAGLHFELSSLAGRNLPDGIIEFWLSEVAGK